MQDRRNLTDADVKAIVDEMEQRMTARFYGDIGRGVWGLVWKAAIAAMLVFAAYGSTKGFK
ncbi:hypothetical protein GJ698_22130 [Pseudoduganella sp. FT26W]|uniref:Uncharacterized protein n=1 Tax=Duganella aquatilis TaxID=2666082 RepID=A0A844D1T0_9BURK|nr:hypothetical protein [Duganella aquatilis]MRW86773.1 hypothetical protein [Duganella aquatilis]